MGGVHHVRRGERPRASVAVFAPFAIDMAAGSAGGVRMALSKTTWLFVVGSTCVTTPAFAQDDIQLPPVTVTATQVPTLLPDVPAGVAVITQSEIQARGYTTLSQALSAVPGLGVVQSGGAGGQSSVFIRGTNSEDVLVLIDGVPANDPSIANGAFNFGEDTLDDIARIEVVRGPMSGIYGSSAIGGVINLITLQGEDAPHASIELAGGFPAQAQGSATISGVTGKFDYALNGNIDEEAGFDETARRLTGYAGNRDPFRSKTGSANLGYTPVNGTRVYVVLRARDSDTGYPDLGAPIFDDPNEFGYDTNLFGKLGVKSNLLSGHLTTELFIARIEDDRRYSNLLDANDPNFAAANDHYHGYRTDLQWNNTIHIPDRGATSLSSILFGVEYINDLAKENVSEAGFTENVNASQHEVAGHLAGQTTLADRLTVTAALRDDSVSSFGNALTGRGGAVLAVPEADMRLKTAYGTGFLAPSLFDLYGVDNFGYVGNPHLKPETGDGYEAGPEFIIPALGQVDAADLSITYFHNDIRNLITTTPDFSSEENIGKVRINGVETDAVLRPVSWLTAEFTYTYTDARDATNNTQLLRRPENAGSVTLTLAPVKRLALTSQINYVGRFQDFLYADNGFPIGDGAADPGTIVNLMASYQATEKLSLFVQAKNLLNSSFEPVNGLQTPGTSVLIGIRASVQ
jgi:vitamin B12 transporter